MFDILFVEIFTEMNSGFMAEIPKEIKFFVSSVRHFHRFIC